MCPAAAATASPVPRGCSWIATSTPSGSCAVEPPLRVVDDDDPPAPASRAASSGHRIIGRPQIGCSTLGSDERMRVPSPAARMTTVGAAMACHRSIGAASAADGGWCNGSTSGFGPLSSGSNPGPPVARRARPRRSRCGDIVTADAPDSALDCAADARTIPRRPAGGPADPRGGRAGRRSDHAARRGRRPACSARATPSSAAPRSSLVRRRGPRRRRRRGDAGAAPRILVRASGPGRGRDGHRARLLRLADLLPRRAAARGA